MAIFSVSSECFFTLYLPLNYEQVGVGTIDRPTSNAVGTSFPRTRFESVNNVAFDRVRLPAVCYGYGVW